MHLLVTSYQEWFTSTKYPQIPHWMDMLTGLLPVSDSKTELASVFQQQQKKACPKWHNLTFQYISLKRSLQFTTSVTDGLLWSNFFGATPL